MIRLACSSNKGYLYQFCDTFANLCKILKQGIKPSDYGEIDWETSKDLKRDEEGMHGFASFTRNPSAILETAPINKWRYAVILDSNVLTNNYRLRPYTFSFRPGERKVKVWADTNRTPRYWGIHIGGATHRITSMTKEEVDSLITWAEGLASEQKAKLNIKDEYDFTPFDRREYSSWSATIVINLGTKEVHLPSDLRPISPREVIHPMAKLLMSDVSESEERLYTKELPGKAKNINIKNAIVGVLLPDTDYYTRTKKQMETKFPNIPVYLYDDRRNRARKAEQSYNYSEKTAARDEQRIKDNLAEHPEDKKKYILPK